jgi:hypothetical protein
VQLALCRYCFGHGKGDSQPFGESVVRDFGDAGCGLGQRLSVEGKAFEVELKRFTKVGAHLFERVTRTGAARNVGRKTAQVGRPAFVDDKVSSCHGFNPACLRIL